MWTTHNRKRYDRSRLRYPSDLTNDEWALTSIAEGERGYRTLGAGIPITSTRSTMTARFFSYLKVHGSSWGQSLTQRRPASPKPRLRSGSRSSPPSTGWMDAAKLLGGNVALPSKA